MTADLVQVLSPVEGLVQLLAQEDWEGCHLGPLLPRRAAAVAPQGVVAHLMVVGVLSRQDTATAGATQR